MNASDRITKHIDDLADWHGKVMAQLRKLIGEAALGIVEEWKWNTPVWSHNGNVVAVGAFRDHVKVNFFKGTLLTTRMAFSTPAWKPRRRGASIFTKAIDSTCPH
jgi:hypothetical protein